MRIKKILLQNGFQLTDDRYSKPFAKNLFYEIYFDQIPEGMTDEEILDAIEAGVQTKNPDFKLVRN